MATGKKTGGRGPGVQNRLTVELKETLKAVVEQEIQDLPERLKGLKDRERIELLVRLLPFVLPKVEPAHYTVGEPSIWNDLPTFR